ncbi:hypothetical protein PGT21_000050 [Puccinia graminis f. sp. tritici]|uniref:Uncharacterized protein n=1 Tax=Puccinia graminis f. sp. tritici TaxID=56615 RepID=A0A5B0LMC3_PUCGR|nr:hypothetical protein PGT21_000050 [Puccinia graminis f. sp. tritici]
MPFHFQQLEFLYSFLLPPLPPPPPPPSQVTDHLSSLGNDDETGVLKPLNHPNPSKLNQPLSSDSSLREQPATARPGPYERPIPEEISILEFVGSENLQRRSYMLQRLISRIPIRNMGQVAFKNLLTPACSDFAHIHNQPLNLGLNVNNLVVLLSKS